MQLSTGLSFFNEKVTQIYPVSFVIFDIFVPHFIIALNKKYNK